MRPLLALLTLTLTLAVSCRDKSDDELIRDAVHRALTAVNEKKPGAVVEDAVADFKGLEAPTCRRSAASSPATC